MSAAKPISKIVSGNRVKKLHEVAIDEQRSSEDVAIDATQWWVQMKTKKSAKTNY